MSSLAEVGGARVGRKVRPESVDDLLPLQPMPRRQGEQLHELGRAPLVPCPSRDAASIDRHLEPTEDAYLDASHTPRMLPAMPAGKDASTRRASCWKTLARGVASQGPSAARPAANLNEAPGGRRCLLQLWPRSVAETLRPPRGAIRAPDPARR
jgi:hypothetical protein